MATITRGLTPADIGTIRETLAAGRRPKVVFTDSAGQVAGQAGQVVGLTDPAASDEWIVVRFGRDELPFSPADLATPTRGTPARRTAPTRAAPPAALPAAAAANGIGNRPPRRPTQPPRPERAQPEPKPAPAIAATPAPGPASPARAAKVARPKAPASLTVTLSYADREWTVAASLGAKTLAKPHQIKPTEALRLVALIDVPGVHEAVENIIEAERVEAENRAARLRCELAEIESRLAELSRHP